LGVERVVSVSRFWAKLGLILSAIVLILGCGPAAQPASTPSAADVVELLPPRETGSVSLETTLARRRSVRRFSDTALSWQEISQLLWAAQGITSGRGFRTAPSAGALYPLEVYAVLAEGLFHYEPHSHSLSKESEDDLRGSLRRAALNQPFVEEAPLVLVIAGDYKKTARRYGDRAERYVILEAGHVAQNVLLQAVALRLGGVPVGAFDDGEVQRVLGLPANLTPLYLIPLGKPPE
jgi:SagB-type dehydrogenase family enzyme